MAASLAHARAAISHFRDFSSSNRLIHAVAAVSDESFLRRARIRGRGEREGEGEGGRREVGFDCVYIASIYFNPFGHHVAASP